MSVDITIRGTTISFPSVSESPQWAEQVIQFAQAVEQALQLVISDSDVTTQSLDISAYNPGTNVSIPNLEFSTTDVRAARISYAVFRATNTNTAYEQGNLDIVYNPNGSTNNKWEPARDYVGDGKISFVITDTGQVQFSTTALSGSSHTGRIVFKAQTLPQS